MYSAIIQLLPYKPTEDELMTECDLIDDKVIAWFSDYFNDTVSPEFEEKVSKEELTNFLAGIGTIDTQKKTITLFDTKTILDTINNWKNDLLKKLLETDANLWNCRTNLQRFRDSYLLFYIHTEHEGKNAWGCGYSSSQAVDELAAHGGETFHIGKIFNYHY